MLGSARGLWKIEALHRRHKAWAGQIWGGWAGPGPKDWRKPAEFDGLPRGGAV
jgi:hypothetical protein